MNEIWKDIEGYEGYYRVSNFGRVKSFCRKTPVILKPRYHRGYPRVALNKNCTINDQYVHRLVAKAFIPNPENKPQINHIDATPSNAEATNLEWVTSAENHKHSVENGLSPRGKKQHLCKMNENDVLQIRSIYGQGWFTLKEIAEGYKVSKSAVSHVVKKRSWAYL